MTFRNRLAATAAGMALVAALAVPVSVASADGAWIDASPKTDWNTAGMAVPTAPKVQVPQGCAQNPSIRAAETVPDQTLVAAGWYLFGAYTTGWDVSVIQATAGFDGMCRPLSFNQFVFVGSVFAGTVSPQPMDSRTDGVIAYSQLFSPNSLFATFSRYKPNDALCCPSSTSIVQYALDTTHLNAPVLKVS